MSQEPKKRHSRQRQGKRRASIKLVIAKSVVCPNCGASKLPHTVCQQCGYYKGVQYTKGKEEVKVSRRTVTDK